MNIIESAVTNVKEIIKVQNHLILITLLTLLFVSVASPCHVKEF